MSFTDNDIAEALLRLSRVGKSVRVINRSDRMKAWWISRKAQNVKISPKKPMRNIHISERMKSWWIKRKAESM